MDHLHKVLQDSHYPAQFFQQAKPQQKDKPIHRKVIGRARVVKSYIKGLNEQ